jgi:hypothetical protein
MNTLSDAFVHGLQDLERRAKLAGSNMTQVCKNTGVARATFERWLHRAPQTIEKYDELQAEVIRLEQAAEKQKAEAGAGS